MFVVFVVLAKDIQSVTWFIQLYRENFLSYTIDNFMSTDPLTAKRRTRL